MHLLRRTGRLDHPNSRSSHAIPTPRGGGLALLIGVAVAALAALVIGPSWSSSAWVALGGAVILAVVGLTDDVLGIGPSPRLFAQVAIGAAIGLVLGGWVGGCLGAIFTPAAVNMVNFMDGINGLCAGHAVVWGIAAMLAFPQVGQPLAVLGAMSLGGGLGFLPWNVPRARLFLGDVGSYLIGGLAGIGVLASSLWLLEGPEPATDWSLIGVVCGPYLLFAVDTVTTAVRRVGGGARLFEAHRTHVYQRLVNEGGMAHWAIALVMSVLSLLVTAAFLVSMVAGAIAAVAISLAYLSSPGYLRHEFTT
jgi:UDP-N-acetylmuramyl pentapeptide phosphotransferase/UDP-N-acetylglucosamine-1-phosphate transferase